MSKKNSKAEQLVVELKDKDTGFHDPATGLKVVRDQRVALGETIGRKTNLALLSGPLLVVSGKGGDNDEQDEPDGFDLPADLPGRDKFIAAGLTTFAAVKELDTDEKVLAIEGIGPGTVKALVRWAKDNAPKDRRR